MRSAAATMLVAMAAAAAAEPVTVQDGAGFREACAAAGPGTVIRLAPGGYAPDVLITGRHGGSDRPIVIEAADPACPPIFTGGNEAIHVTSCSHLILRNLTMRGQKDNGLNIDDGSQVGSSHHVLVEHMRVEDVGPCGNHDAIKLSGLDDFIVRGCTVHGWGGQGVDMVGCHRGLIDRCSFTGKEGFTQTAGVQAKGGSREITIRRCAFDRAGDRAIHAGGSTGDPFFRPINAPYEAAAITVEGCTFHGGETPIGFVGVDGAVFRFNTVHDPGRWICRILQERAESRFVPCRNGRLERNIFVYRAANVRTAVNVGAGTSPETFAFAANLWFAIDDATAGPPQLPVAEQSAVHGVDPRLEAPCRGEFTPLAPAAMGYGATAFRSADPP